MRQLVKIFRSIYGLPYNKEHYLFAIYRAFLWKYIRLFKITNYKWKIWDNRYVFLHYDSIQCMWLMFNYIIDWEEFHLIEAIVQEDEVAFDIGSNIGLYSLWISKYNTGGTIHLFEPDDKNFDRLQENINLNGLQHRLVLNKTGISEKKGQLYFTTGGDVLNHLSVKEEANTVKVEVTTLDEYCKMNAVAHIRYMKIDIEGFELAAFKGGKEILKEGIIDIIQFELNSAVDNASGTQMEVVQYLKSFDYHLARYDIKNRRLEEISYSPERENYFAIKNIEKMNLQLSTNRQKKSYV